MAIQLISSDGSIITEQLASCSWDITVPVSTDNNLLYGGVVTWLQDYDFYVSPAGYFINGNFYESPEAYVTLSPADPSLDRFDVIYLDADQVVKVSEGDPSLTPSQPGLDLGLELGLSSIFVEAGSSSPVDLIVECLSGWTATGSDGDVDVASPSANCVDTTGLEVTNGDNGDYALYDRGSVFNPSDDFNIITFRLKPKGDWSNDANLNHRIKFQWYLAGLPVGSAVYLGDTGFNFSNTNYSCQIISIPIIQFGLSPSVLADQFRVTVVSEYNPPSYPFGFYLDGLCMQGGIFGATESDDIHNQEFGPQTPGRYWIAGNARIEGWVTSPDMLTGGGGSEKFGWGARVSGSTGTAVGFLAQANGQEGATAIGNQSVANVGVAIGFGARSNRGVSVGGSQLGSGGVAVGGGSQSLANGAIAIGDNAVASNILNITVGGTAGPDYSAISLGIGSVAAHRFSMAFGSMARTTGNGQVVFGGQDLYSSYGFYSLHFGSGVTSPFNSDRLWTITGSEGTDTPGDNWYHAGAKATGDADGGSLFWQTSDAGVSGTTLQSLSTKMGLNSNTLGLYLNDVRFQMDEGADVVSANDLTLGKGNSFTVTGNTGINAITSTNWQDGAVIYLLFTGTPTIQHNVAGGVGTSPIRLAGSLDFSATNNTVLQLQLKDGYWREVGRTQASALGPYTFTNGLHEEFGGTVQLGGTLIEDTTIILSINDFVLNKTGAGDIQFKSLDNSVTANVLFYDTVTGTISYGIAPGGGGGDVTGNNGLTENVADNLQWGGTLVQNTSIAQATFSITYTNGAGRTFVSDPTNQVYQFGDIDFTFPGLGSNITIDDAQQRFLFSTGGLRFLDANKSAGTYSLGDIDAGTNGLYLEIDDANQTWTATNIPTGTTSDIIYYDSVTGLVTYGTAPTTFPGITADNGLTANTSTNVQLFGPVGTPATLLDDRYLTAGAFGLNVTANSATGGAIMSLTSAATTATTGQRGLNISLSGANAASGVNSRGILVSNTHTGTGSINFGILAIGNGADTNNYGVYGIGGGASSLGTGAGVYGDSNVGGLNELYAGVRGAGSSGSVPLSAYHYNGNGTDVYDGLQLMRRPSNPALVGSGMSIYWYMETGGHGAFRRTNAIESRWTNVTDGAHSASLVITGVDNAITADLLTIKGTGQLQGNKYGVGSFTSGTAAYVIATDSSGNFFEYPAGGLGGNGLLISANNGLSASTTTNVVLGQAVGTVGNPGALLSNREIPGAFNVALTSNSAQLGVGVSNTSLAALSQNLAAYKSHAAAATAAGVAYFQSTFTPSGAVVYTGLNSLSTGTVLELTSGYYTPATSAADISGIAGIIQVQNNNGTQTTGPISGMVGAVVTIGDIKVLDLATIKAKAPRAASGGGLSAITNMYGVYISGQNALSGTTNSYGIYQAGLTDKNYFGSVVGIGVATPYVPVATRLDVVDDALAGNSMVNLTSTSIAANGSTQKMLNISLSGANTNASQNTYGIYSVNSHTGTTPINVAIYGEVSNGIGSGAGIKGVATGAQRGVWGDASGGTGVVGSSTSGTGGSFSATSGGAIVASTTSGQGITVSSDSGLPAYFSQIPASTNTVVEIARIVRGTTGTAANGIAGAIDYYTEESSGVALFSNRIASSWTDVTNGTRSAALTISGTFNAATVDFLTLAGNGSMKLRPITATEASAITPAEGMIVIVNTTNGTFTSVGFWGYSNSAWGKF